MKARKIIVHCSDSPNGKWNDIESIRRFHKAPPPEGRGWSDIGYHAVIQPDGSTQNGRGLNEVGAHCSGENHDSIGICLIGKDKFTLEQLISLKSLVDTIRRTYDIPKWAVYCHNQFASAQAQGKTCPNLDVNRLLFWLWCEDLKAIECYRLS